jgi:hypothetical protein
MKAVRTVDVDDVELKLFEIKTALKFIKKNQDTITFDEVLGIINNITDDIDMCMYDLR